MTIVGIVPYQFLPARIGGQKAIEQFFSCLGSKASVTIISTADNNITDAKNFSLLPLFSNSFLRYGNFFYLKKIKKIFQHKKVDYLFLEQPYMGWIAIYLKRKFNIPLVIHSLNIESTRFKSLKKPWWKILWYYERHVYKSSDFVFFITEDDRRYAIDNYRLPLEKAFVAPYGTEIKQAPDTEQRKNAKKQVCDSLQIDYNYSLLLFNGSFDYLPNADALQNLIEKVVPLLNNEKFLFKLIICGRNISRNVKDIKPENVVFLDYVDDIFLYNLATDVFVNPVILGGGIKTKLVEALAAGANAVSVRSGALGVDSSLCNEKLYITEDNDWTSFASAIKEAANNDKQTGSLFYQNFFIGNIMDRVIKTISSERL